MTITDNVIALFRERAKTELASGCDVSRLRWDDVVEALCKEVTRLRKELAASGDAAKLREALDESRRIASDLGGCRLNDYWKLNEIVRVCDAALAAPPRNCDVGTPDEQARRFERFCNRYDHDCTGCPCEDMGCASLSDCFANWAQMPYEAEEGGAK